MEMKNEVIEVINSEHGKKVIDYWKKKGVNTKGLLGIYSKENNEEDRYYGVINNSFDNYCLENVRRNNATIIELPSENEDIFKEKDRVYHILNGFGVVEEFTEKNTRVLFDNKVNSWVDTRLLSFTEYTLNGFTQERPITLPEVGEICLFRDSNNEDWICRRFKEYHPNKPYPFLTKCNTNFRQMKRIKILD